MLKAGKADTFYAELERAVLGYFSDKLNVPLPRINAESIEASVVQIQNNPELMNKIRLLLQEVSFGRFAVGDKPSEKMKEVYGLADEVITYFERMKHS